jgi:hypothetical protein
LVRIPSQKEQNKDNKGVKMDIKIVIMAGGLLLFTWVFVFFMWLREMKKEYEEIEVLEDNK